jgi:hypothetical protein
MLSGLTPLTSFATFRSVVSPQHPCTAKLLASQCCERSGHPPSQRETDVGSLSCYVAYPGAWSVLTFASGFAWSFPAFFVCFFVVIPSPFYTEPISSGSRPINGSFMLCSTGPDSTPEQKPTRRGQGGY